MAYDLEEQEQLEGLKAFWKRHGNFIMTVITVVLLVIAGYRGWQWYQLRQAGDAAVLYEQLRGAVDAKDMARIKEAAGSIFEKYSGTAYAEMAALVASKAYLDGGDQKSAKAPLQWAADKATDAEFRHIARLRLSAILLDERAYDEALKLLGAQVPARFAPLYADRRGDVLAAQDKTDEARAQYKQALDGLDPGSPLRRLVQLKLDGLGGAAS